MPPPSAAAISAPPDAAPPAATVPAAGFSHQQIIQVITGILLCILLVALDQTVVIPAVPTIATDLHAFGHLSWIVSAYLLTSTAATPIYGRLSDMYGRRLLLLPALALFVLASVLCAMAQSLPQLIVFRALQGLGGAGMMAMAQAAIADVVSPRERGRYQGYMAGTWGVASVAGPVVGGWVTDHLSWTYVFWVNVPLGLMAMWLCNRALKILPVRRMGGRIDYVGAALLTVGVTGFLLVLSWGGSEYAWVSAPIAGLAAVTAVLFALLVWYERRVGDRGVLPPRMFREPVFSRGVALAFLTAAGLLGTTFLLPLFFQLVRGANASQSGFLVIPFLLFNTLGAFGGGQLCRRLGKTRAVILGGFGAGSAGFAGLALVGAHTPVALVFVPMAVVGLGIGVCMPTVLVMVQNASPRRDVGTVTGALLFLRSMGGAFGATLVGALLTAAFVARLAAAGYPGMRDLGALKPDGPLALLGPVAQAAGIEALSGGFRLAFAASLALSVLGIVIALGLRDIPLRSISSSDPDQAGAVGH